MGVRAGDLDFVFLSYDEPNAPAHWLDLLGVVPRAKHVQGVKGMASAFRRAAGLAETEHFFTVDADTRLDPCFLEHAIDDDKINAERVISWPSRNVVNGLTYGHGGVKCWTRRLLREDRTPDADHIDYTLRLGYIFEARSFSTSHPNPTPLHAFRAGFREGVKLALVHGRPAGAARFFEEVARTNQQRLQIWGSLGADAEHGLWCIYGARMGCAATLLEQPDLALLADFERFGRFFDEHVMPPLRGSDHRCQHSGLCWSAEALQQACTRLGERLNLELGLGVVEVGSEQSAFIKQVCGAGMDLAAFDMLGNLYRTGDGMPKDPARAAEQYRIGAGLGHSNAMNNLARLYLRGEGVARDEDRAVQLLWQAGALGNQYAPHQLARMRLKGWAMERDLEAAVELLELAAARGFRQADLELGQMFAAGDATRADPLRALRHFILAGDLGADEASSLSARLTPDVIAVAQAQAAAQQRARNRG
jgi:TPR repeat protein